ncbi:hypothetical protein [Helicobacter pylori]
MRFLHDTTKAIKQPFLRQPPTATKNPNMFQIFAPQKQRKSFHKI